MLSDYKELTFTPLLFSTVCASLETFMLWGYSNKFWSLIVFVLLYGATAGGFGVLRLRFSAAIVSDESDRAQGLLVLSLLTAIRGVAVVTSGYVASGLLNESAKLTDGFGVGKWSKVILFVGSMMLVASLGIVGGLFQEPRKGNDSTKGIGDIEIELRANEKTATVLKGASG